MDAARALVETAADAELFLYPGNRHLFIDSSLPSHGEPAATQATDRVLDFLDRIKGPGSADADRSPCAPIARLGRRSAP